MIASEGQDYDGHFSRFVAYSPSTDWNCGGPILYREKISIDALQDEWGAQFSYLRYDEDQSPSRHRMNGETPLIAAMRTYVSYKFGPFFEVDENGVVKTFSKNDDNS